MRETQEIIEKVAKEVTALPPEGGRGWLLVPRDLWNRIAEGTEWDEVIRPTAGVSIYRKDKVVVARSWISAPHPLIKAWRLGYPQPHLPIKIVQPGGEEARAILLPWGRVAGWVDGWRLEVGWPTRKGVVGRLRKKWRLEVDGS